jgi:adenosylcobinamide-GDP ribazoletransferase
LRFVAAFRFLTVILLPIRRDATPEEVGGSIVYFPVVGLIIGLILAALYWLLGMLLPPAIVVVLLMVAMVLVNGVLHLDGFIDTCDGLAGNKTVEERWRVMRDSRVGAFGIAGAALLLLVKYASLYSLPERLIVGSLVLMPVVSRWAMVYAIVAYPYARPSGLGTVFKQEASGRRFALATLFTVAVAIALAWWSRIPYFYLCGLAVVLGVWVITTAWAHYLKRKLAGLTGDSYGAINEVAEVSVLIIVNLLAYNGWLWVG